MGDKRRMLPLLAALAETLSEGNARTIFCAQIVSIVVPLIMIAVSVPMILQKGPAQSPSGFRTQYTLSSDQMWYRANTICRIAGVVAVSLG